MDGYTLSGSFTVTAFAVVVDDGQGRGQAVITGSTVIAPQVWWQAAEHRPPER